MAVPARPPSPVPRSVPAILLLFGSILVAAGPPAGAMEAVDFPQAVARALRSNPAVAAAGFDYAAAQQDAETARGRYLPELAFGLLR